MRSIVEDTPLSDLRRNLDAVELEEIPDGSGAARGPGTAEGWIRGLAMTRLYGPGVENRLPRFAHVETAVVNLISALPGPRVLHQLMVNRLRGGASLQAHRDGLPLFERWHLPVVTAPEVEWWDEENGWLHLSAGSWWGPMDYTRRHAMINGSTIDRVHVVADLGPAIRTEEGS